jgi:hypothetical protein
MRGEAVRNDIVAEAELQDFQLFMSVEAITDSLCCGRCVIAVEIWGLGGCWPNLVRSAKKVR